jgi:hypothetical protein
MFRHGPVSKPLIFSLLLSRHWRRLVPQLFCVVLFLITLAPDCLSQTQRVVVVQFDGLPFDVVDRFVRERDPRTGRSRLPWFDHIFYQGGSRLANFYVRGMSLSAPSWSLIDSGQHLQIKGNVEFDRYTMQTYDYLNFIPFYIQATIGKRIDMQGVEVLDSLGIPLLSDAFPRNERHATFSLFQRGPRYSTFQKALENRVRTAPRELFDEWAMGGGTGLRNAVPDQFVKELIEGLNNPRIRYLELVNTDFDHNAHHNNDRESHLAAIRELDSMVGEIWTAIQKTPQASETALIVVSDHGINSDERVYSQGYNLVKLLASAAGGGHHVITKRRLLLDYAIKGVVPFVPIITTTTRDSFYLQGQSSAYPTALLDFDGNERASIHLRDSDLNLLHIILQQLQRNDLPPTMRRALSETFFATVDRRRTEWQQNLDALNEDLVGLRKAIVDQKALCDSRPKKFTKEETEADLDNAAKRICVRYDIMLGQDENYSAYARAVTNLLALRKESFNPVQLKILSVIAPHAMGEHNSIHALQNYVVGVAPAGLVLKADGSLDEQRSFIHIDYLSLLHDLNVRNNVQPGVSSRPVDLLALRIPAEQLKPLIGDTDITPDVIWVTAGPDSQALILAREDANKQLSFRYLPIKQLTQDLNGAIHFEKLPWQPGLPLKIFEDPDVNIPVSDRAAWLSSWHTDLEWLRALHRGRYSNGLIGLHEELARHQIPSIDINQAGLSEEERTKRRFLRRLRENIEADLLVVATDHWNFDVRGFNPGGNHGSFLRISTHSTFMIAGGDKTGIPRALEIDEPYDSLSFLPTVLALTGNLRDDNNPTPALRDKGFRRLPGRPVKELLTLPAWDTAR